MATAIHEANYTLSDGTKITVTDRLTYTLSEYTTYYKITCTKLETKASVAGKLGLVAGDIYIYYYDSTGARRYEDSGLNRSACSPTKSYQTRWSGSKTFTTYRQTYLTSFAFDSSILVSIPTLPTYKITFSAPGASTVPDPAYKYHGVAKTLLTTKPTKTGYTFVNWLSSYDSKYYLPGASYTVDAPTTMTAQWTANKYTVSYNANGGSGTVASQTKTYDTALNFQSGSTLSRKDTVSGITREYELLRWNTNPDNSGTPYELGSAIPNITNNLAVYAIWNVKYLYPKLTGLQDYRTATSDITDKTRADSGEYIYITFDFVGCSDDNGANYNVPDCTVRIDDDVYTPTLEFDSGTNTGTLEFKPNALYSKDNPHNIIIELTDPNHTASSFRAYDYITTAIYPIDLYSNDDDSEVYMGLMHPYIGGVPLTVPDTYVEGEIDTFLEVDGNASSSTAAVDGYDKDLFNAIRTLGWYDDIITTRRSSRIKKLFSNILNWGGLKITWDHGTENTTDTWVPVFRNEVLQHRVIPSNANATATKVGNYYSAGSFNIYRRGNCVTIAGTVTMNELSARTTVATVPAGFRPPETVYGIITSMNEYFLVYSTGGIAFNKCAAGARWFTVTYCV